MRRSSKACVSLFILLGLAAATALTAGPASADVHLRVESQPRTGPIDAFVTVRKGVEPISGLTAANFSVRLDGAPLNIGTFGLPPAQDAAQKKSIAFVVDVDDSSYFFSNAHNAIARFVQNMAVGEYAAIVTRSGHVIWRFARIDDDADRNVLIRRLEPQWEPDFPPFFPPSDFFTALVRAVEQFATYPVVLNEGPKAIVLVGPTLIDVDWPTQSRIVADANASGIPIFTISLGPGDPLTSLLTALADDTGGAYIRQGPNGAFMRLESLLNDAYRLTFPQATVSDCYPHVLEVTVARPAQQDQSASLSFTRCDTTPSPFKFAPAIDVTPGSIVVSKAATIKGIESPVVAVEVFDGRYSIGCGTKFTSAPGILSPGDKVCVRHTASKNFGSTRSTTLVVGGVSSEFYSVTSAAP